MSPKRNAAIGALFGFIGFMLGIASLLRYGIDDVWSQLLTAFNGAILGGNLAVLTLEIWADRKHR